jgi:hypothetical protein
VRIFLEKESLKAFVTTFCPASLNCSLACRDDVGVSCLCDIRRATRRPQPCHGPNGGGWSGRLWTHRPRHHCPGELCPGLRFDPVEACVNQVLDGSTLPIPRQTMWFTPMPGPACICINRCCAGRQSRLNIRIVTEVPLQHPYRCKFPMPLRCGGKAGSLPCTIGCIFNKSLVFPREGVLCR